jgi:hypothetical protein
MAATIVDVETKQAALRMRKLEETKLAKKIEEAIQTGNLSLEDDDEIPRGCIGKITCNVFGRRRSRAAKASPLKLSDVDITSAKSEKVQSSTSSRIFGQRGKQQADAATKLQTASLSLTARAEALEQKLSDAKKKAVALKKAGKTTEALAALKRAKILQKQYDSALSASVAIEAQVDLLAETELHREVSDALAQTVKSVKKRSKGVLEKAETAADDASEIKDLAEDVATALGGLNTMTDFDDDELLNELKSMMDDDDTDEAAHATPLQTQPQSQHAPTPNPVTKLASYPSVPIGEKEGLLASS